MCVVRAPLSRFLTWSLQIQLSCAWPRLSMGGGRGVCGRLCRRAGGWKIVVCEKQKKNEEKKVVAKKIIPTFKSNTHVSLLHVAEKSGFGWQELELDCWEAGLWGCQVQVVIGSVGC